METVVVVEESRFVGETVVVMEDIVVVMDDIVVVMDDIVVVMDDIVVVMEDIVVVRTEIVVRGQVVVGVMVDWSLASIPGRSVDMLIVLAEHFVAEVVDNSANSNDKCVLRIGLDNSENNNLTVVEVVILGIGSDILVVFELVFVDGVVVAVKVVLVVVGIGSENWTNLFEPICCY